MLGKMDIDESNAKLIDINIPKPQRKPGKY